MTTTMTMTMMTSKDSALTNHRSGPLGRLNTCPGPNPYQSVKKVIKSYRLTGLQPAF